MFGTIIKGSKRQAFGISSGFGHLLFGTRARSKGQDMCNNGY
jgi:hypothetical protein